MPDISELMKDLIRKIDELCEIDLRDYINIKPKGKEPDFSYFFSEKANIKLDDTEADSTRLSNGYEITQRNLEILNNLASYTQKDFAFCRVSDAIGNDYEQWNKSDPVFIDAPTGTGKTTFVYEKLIPEALSKGCGVLIVSNRIALSMQQKRKIFDLIKKIDPESLNGLRKEDIDEKTVMIGPVCVTTYQGLYNLFNTDISLANFYGFHTHEEIEAEKIKVWSRRLRYAIFDEIHFLYSDAEFNDFCGFLLNYITYVFRDVIRVYMTATSWEILDYIRKYEMRIYERNEQNPPQAPFMDQYCTRHFNNKVANSGSFPPKKREFCHYKIGTDYSRYKLRFFSVKQNSHKSKTEDTESETTKKANAVLNIMEKSKPSERNKWIVFVDNKGNGKNLYDVLRKEHSVAYIDRTTSLPDNEIKKAIINNECFEQSVLITTPVIDSGVNICDENVKNIAIFYTDRTQFIQSLGRKRLKEGENGINVWAFVPSEKSFNERVKRYNKDALMGIRLLFAIGSRQYYFDRLNSKKASPTEEQKAALAEKQEDTPTEKRKATVDEQVTYLVNQNVRDRLTDEHFRLFRELAYGQKYKDINRRFADGTKGGYASLIKELYTRKDATNTKSLTYVNGDGLITTNIYTLGVILGKKEFLKRFAGPYDKEDYRSEVGNWLGLTNIIKETEAEAAAQRQSEKDKLARLLDQNLEQVISDKDFQKLRKAVIDAHIIVVENSYLSKRSNDRKAEVKAKALNKLLEDMGLDYIISSEKEKEDSSKKGKGYKKTDAKEKWYVTKKNTEK